MLDLTILMPCCNEESTIRYCIEEAQTYLIASDLQGEVLVVDNNSTDRSAAIAASLGARVVPESVPGYGSALRPGIAEAAGRVIIFADSDTTYDFAHLDPLYRPLAEGRFDMMVGIRRIQPGAMSLSHILGVRFLSALARWRFHTDVRDFHCGIRGITREAASRCTWTCPGMEFATEMIAEAVRVGLRIGQTEVPLRKCQDAKRKPKLRTIRDGLRHLRFICAWKVN